MTDQGKTRNAEAPAIDEATSVGAQNRSSVAVGGAEGRARLIVEKLRRIYDHLSYGGATATHDELDTIRVAADLLGRPVLPASEELLTALKAARQFLDPEIDRGPSVNGWRNTVDLVDAAIAASGPPVLPGATTQGDDQR